MLRRGDIDWANLREPVGSEPGYRRPVLIVSADAFNDSRIHTVIGVAITSNLALADAPGNVDLPAEDSGLVRDSVLNVSQVITLDKAHLGARAGSLDAATMRSVEAGLRLVLQLSAETGGVPATTQAWALPTVVGAGVAGSAHGMSESPAAAGRVPEQPTLEGLEARQGAWWEAEGVYRFDRGWTRAEVFSIETPPPTVSGSLQVGHVFSYTHTDLVTRYQRMRGREVFYPMCWDDNGLPTERRVLNDFGVRCDPSVPHDENFAPPADPGCDFDGREVAFPGLGGG